MQARQGDVLIERIDRMPKGAKKLERNGPVILAHGEATGHAHTIESLDVEMYETAAAADRYLRVGRNGATVVHQEHGPISLEEGMYMVRRQREYSPGEIRRVAD